MPLSDVIVFGEWLPDQPANRVGVQVAENVFTNGEFYIPVKALASQSDALSAACIGAYSFIQSDGNTDTFAATSTKIFQLNSGSWDDVTNTGGDYSTGSEDSFYSIRS